MVNVGREPGVLQRPLRLRLGLAGDVGHGDVVPVAAEQLDHTERAGGDHEQGGGDDADPEPRAAVAFFGGVIGGRPAARAP